MLSSTMFSAHGTSRAIKLASVQSWPTNDYQGFNLEIKPAAKVASM